MRNHFERNLLENEETIELGQISQVKFDDAEERIIRYYLEEFKPCKFGDLVKESAQPACILIRTYLEKNTSITSSNFLCNKDAESLFGYKSEELQLNNDKRDLLMLQIRRTSNIQVPAMFS